MVNNIDLRVRATSNMGSVYKDAQRLESSFNGVGRSVASLRKQWADGTLDNQGFDRATGKIDDYRRNLMIAADASGQYYTATKQITAQTTKFNEQLANQKVRMRDVFGKGNLSMVRSAMKEQMALNNMIATGFTRDATGQMTASMMVPKDLGQGRVAGLRTEMGYYNQVLRSVSLETINWGKNMQWAGRQLTVGFSVPLTLAMTALAYLGKELDAQLVRVVKVYGDSESAFSATNESIRAMATDTAKFVAGQYGLMASSTNDVMAELAATGLEGAELQKMTTEVQRASLLGEMGSEDSLKMLRTLRAAYRLNSDEIGGMVNFFNEIENSTALTMQDISEGLPRISGIMQAVGVSIEDSTVLLTAFKEAGVDVAEGATALKSISFKAIAASPTAKNNFFEITGQDMQELIDKNNSEFMPMMQDLADIMANLTQGQKVNLIKDVFGIHQGSKAITIIDQLASSSEGMVRAQEIAQRSSTSLAASAASEVKALQESTSFQVNALLAKAVIELQALGEVALEIMLPVGKAIVSLLQMVNNIPDGMKKAGLSAAMILAVFGPLVMFTGLMGNLIGMAGRGAGAIAGLVLKFKVLNPEAKAAELLQRAMAASTSVNTKAIIAQTAAITGLHGAMAKASHAAFPGSNSLQRGGARASVKPASNINVGPSIANSSKAIDDKSASINKNWEGISRNMALGSGAALGISMLFNNQMVSNIAMIGLAIGSLAPLAGTAGKKIAAMYAASAVASKASAVKMADSLGAIGVAGKTQGAKLSGAFGKAATGVRAAMGTIGTAMMGPWGIAVGAAVLGATYLWKKHRDEIKEVKEAYDGMANSTKTLAEAYGILLDSPLEMARNDPKLKEDSIALQTARLKEMEDTGNKQIEIWNKYSAQLAKENDGIVDSQRAANDAIRQSQILVSQGATPEEALRAAWDAYRAMTKDAITLDAFKVKVDWTPETFSDVSKIGEDMFTGIQESIDTARGKFTAELGLADSERNTSKFRFDTATKADVDKQMTELLSFYKGISDDDGKLNFVRAAFGETGATFSAAFDKGIESGLLTSTNSLEDALKQMRTVAQQFELTGNPSMDIGISSGAIQNMQQYLPLLEDTFGAEETFNGIIKNNSEAMSGYTKMIMGLVMQMDEYAEIQARFEEKTSGSNRLDPIVRAGAIAERAAAISQLEEQARTTKVAEGVTGKMTSAQDALTAAMEEAGIATADTTDKIDDQGASAEKAAEEAAALAEGIAAAYNATLDDLTEGYMQQLDDTFEAESDALSESGQAQIDAIEESHNVIEETAQAAHDVRMENIENAQQREQDTLDAQRKTAEEALQDAQDLEQEIIDEARLKADKRLEKTHEAQNAAIDRKEAAANQRFDNMEKIAERDNERERKSLDARWEKINDAQSLKEQGDNDRLGDRQELDSEKQDARQDARNEKLSKRQEKRSEALGERQEKINKALQRLQEKREEAQDRRQEKRSKALEDRQEKRSEAAEVNQEKRSKALDERQERRQEQLDENQEKRRDARAKYFDDQVTAINNVIEAEEKAEKKRQEMFDKERERIRRLSDLYGSNVDINVAINSGDIDEAARISSEINTKQEEWGQDDVSANSQSAADIKKEKREKEIDAIEELKEASLKALEEVEEAEKKALKAKEERENEALKKQFKREDKALKLREEREKANLDRQFKIEDKALQAREEREKEALNRQFKRQDKALKAREERERKALDAQRKNEDKALQKRQQAEDRALALRHKNQQKALSASKEIEENALSRKLENIKTEIDKQRVKESKIYDAQRVRLKASQEAESASIAKSRKRSDKALNKEFAKQNEALADDYEMRSKRLNKRYDRKKKTVTKEFEMEKEVRTKQREADVKVQQDKNKIDQRGLQRRQEQLRKSLQRQLEYERAKSPKTEKEVKNMHDNIFDIFKGYNKDTRKTDKKSTNKMMEDRQIIIKTKMRELSKDKDIPNYAKQATGAMTKAIMGIDLSGLQLKKFMKTGNINGTSIAPDKQRASVDRDVALHSGGVVGDSRYDKRTGITGGPSHREQMVNMLKGEGVLNNRAMSQPGVKEWMDDVNSGRVPVKKKGAFIGGGMSGLIGSFAKTLGNVSVQTATSAMETGIAKNQASSGSTGSYNAKGGKASGLSSSQLNNAQAIIKQGRSMGASKRDLVIAIMTAMQESTLKNINYGDRDSVGLFQQRTSQGWGSKSQIMDPAYSSRKFFEGLLGLSGRSKMSLTQAAQAVQRSAYPNAYAKWEGLAGQIVSGGGKSKSTSNRLDRTLKERFAEITANSKNLFSDGAGLAGGGLGGSSRSLGRDAKSGFPGWQSMSRVAKGLGGIITSAFRGGSRTRSGSQSYHGLGRAVDIAGSANKMMEIFNSIRSRFGKSAAELYYSPAGGRQIRQGNNYNTKGTPAWSDHFDHVHWAARNGGRVPGNGFGDKVRAMLEPNEFVVKSAAAKANSNLLRAVNGGVNVEDALMSFSKMTKDANGNIDSGSRAEYNVEVNINGNVDKSIDIERVVYNALRKAESRRGPSRSIRG